MIDTQTRSMCEELEFIGSIFGVRCYIILKVNTSSLVELE